MFMKENRLCPDPECPYCGLHCPYCGTTDLVLDPEGERMGCPTCVKSECLPDPAYIAERHLQVQEFTGQRIAEWRARANQLAPGFHWRWRTALYYLDPVASAALSRCDDLMVNGMPFVDALAQTLADIPELRRLVAEHPAFGTTRLLEVSPFVDDWL